MLKQSKIDTIIQDDNVECAETKNFEEALIKLEDIVKKMESGELTLEESLKQFEEGMNLKEVCRSLLDKAETQVEYLLKEKEKRDEQ